MKPSAFTYHRPADLAQTLAVLARVAPEGKVLAGGQSLLPILSMRLAAVRHLVDVNRVAELDYVHADAGGVRIGALARHARVERDDAAAAVQPLLRQALALVAHPTIRNRGTCVGSLAHADPSGELTAVLALTGGSVTVARARPATPTGPGDTIDPGDATGPGNPAGPGETAGALRRRIPAADFFRGPLDAAIGPAELAVEAFFPALPARSGSAFVEVARRHGDYAVCGVAAIITLAEDGTVTAARTGYVSKAPTPVVLDLTAAAPHPSALTDPAAWRAAADVAAGQLTPDGDIHATAEYRAHLGRVLTARALARAAATATGSATATATGSATAAASGSAPGSATPPGAAA